MRWEYSTQFPYRIALAFFWDLRVIRCWLFRIDALRKRRAYRIHCVKPCVLRNSQTYPSHPYFICRRVLIGNIVGFENILMEFRCEISLNVVPVLGVRNMHRSETVFLWDFDGCPVRTVLLQWFVSRLCHGTMPSLPGQELKTTKDRNRFSNSWFTLTVINTS